MKCEIFLMQGEPAFSFRLRDLQTEEDKQAVCRMIGQMHSAHGENFMPDHEWLAEILASCSFNRIGFTVRKEKGKIKMFAFIANRPPGTN
ncbi:MAG: hypothetical protein P4N41_16840 [Negativicutes bacterium]|nr:hypothetical protein [Negativicutes bacterium]